MITYIKAIETNKEIGMQNTVTASWETLVSQASGTADEYFWRAVARVGASLGMEDSFENRKVVVREHAVLVAAHMNAASQDFLSSCLTVASQNVCTAINYIGDVIYEQ